MSLWRDDKYLRLVSNQLEHFRQKKAHEFNFRCPICGDSERNKFKARGYVFPVRDGLMFKCHNCGQALPFRALLKIVSRKLYDEYIMERLREDSERARTPEPQRPEPTNNVVQEPAEALQTTFPGVPSLFGVSVTSDQPEHQVYRFAKDTRKLPDSAMIRLFATVHARSWLKPLVGIDKVGADDQPKITDGVAFLVQPLRLQDGTWYGAQLRGIEKKEFYTFRWSHAPLKMFGLEAWSPAKLTYIIEGPIDAMFVPNSLSPCGSDMLSAVQVLEEQHIIPTSTQRVYVWDNEPRNDQIKRHMRTAIKMHEAVVIWPKHYPKDINDMVRQGIDVNTALPKRTFTGLAAELEFSQWQKN